MDNINTVYAMSSKHNTGVLGQVKIQLHGSRCCNSIYTDMPFISLLVLSNNIHPAFKHIITTDTIKKTLLYLYTPSVT